MTPVSFFQLSLMRLVVLSTPFLKSSTLSATPASGFSFLTLSLGPFLTAAGSSLPSATSSVPSSSTEAAAGSTSLKGSDLATETSTAPVRFFYGY